MANILTLAGKIPVTLAVALLALAAFSCEPLARQFEIELTQPGRIGAVELLGCHLLHWSSEHLFWDLGMFCLIGGLCELRSRKMFVGILLVSACTIPLAVAILHPTLTSYRGLSGIDTGLFTFIALSILLERWATRDFTQVTILASLLVLLFVKIAFEFYSGNVLFVSQENFTPLPIAHLVGAFVGLLARVWIVRQCGSRLESIDCDYEAGPEQSHINLNCTG